MPELETTYLPPDAALPLADLEEFDASEDYSDAELDAYMAELDWLDGFRQVTL